MIRIIGKIPKSVTIACSGGLDSMVILDFLLKGRRDITLAYFNHDTAYSKEAENFVRHAADKHELPLLVGKCSAQKGKRSFEEYWRDERYNFLERIKSDFIITCHHLDDSLETWIMGACHGQPKLIPYSRGTKIFRPFLMTPRSTLLRYASENQVGWIEDPSNACLTYSRNQVRHKVVPELLKVNPGIRTVIRKKLLEKYRGI